MIQTFRLTCGATRSLIAKAPAQSFFNSKIGPLSNFTSSASPLRSGSHSHNHSHHPAAPTESQIIDILKKEFEPPKMVVKDVSGGCGSMFDIYIESAKFKGKTLVSQHKMVNQSLQEQIKGMHGLTIKTKAV